MFRLRLLPVWAGIVLLSGMFLMGQQAWAPPCADNDGDGYGDPASPACDFPGLDCDDGDPGVNPGATEGPFGNPVCSDLLDNDCDILTDEADPGCRECSSHGECDDGNPCTDDYCLIDGTCMLLPDDDNPCDDGNECTMGDACREGVCSAFPMDVDGDTHVSDACGGDDCDDADPDVHPEMAEVCDNGKDDDCDTFVDVEDDDCFFEVNGVYSVSPSIYYTCGFTMITIAINTMSFSDNGSTLDVLGTPQRRCTLHGPSAILTGRIDVSCTVQDLCFETYRLRGDFIDEEHWSGTLTAMYSGAMCPDCSPQTWNISGTR